MDTVTTILSVLGYTVTSNDTPLLLVLMDKVAGEIKNYTNQLIVPDELLTDMYMAVAGEFLVVKKGSGQLDIETLDLDGVTSIKEGDTQVNFSETDSSKFDSVISYLQGWKEDASAFRRIRW